MYCLTIGCNYNFFHTGPLKTDRSCSLSWLCTCRSFPSILYTHGLTATWIMTAEQVKGYRGSLSEHTTTKLVQQAGTKVTRAYLPPERRIGMSVGLLTPFARRLSGSIRLSIVKPFKGGLRVRHWSQILTRRGQRSTGGAHLHVISTHQIWLEESPVVAAASFWEQRSFVTSRRELEN